MSKSMETLDHSLKQYVEDQRFPCIMAKAVFSKGRVSENLLTGADPAILAQETKDLLYRFVERFQVDTQKLSSFFISFSDPTFTKFENFEIFFWSFLTELDRLDKTEFSADPRVRSDPHSDKFSFSIRGEAFFMLVLHPESPRLARRYSKPTIVFNAHSQFEDLRKKGIFHKVRDLIRKRDHELQSVANSMLMDYGTRSEVFQYLGKEYPTDSKCPFTRFKKWFSKQA